MIKKAVLLINLGSPDSTSIPDVRKYLKEFLNDPRVIDSSPLARWILLNCFLLPFRPKKTAEAYQRIWTKDGSPLILCSQAVQRKIAETVDMPIELAMRYGTPSIKETILKLKDKGIQELFIIPLYPHYAMSSYETALVETMQSLASLAPTIKTTTLQPFYKDEGYINALVESARPYLDQGYDHLLFSYHGIPQKHLVKSDPSHAHCLTVPDCCNTCHPAHATCYKHQCLETTKHFVEKANIPKEKYSISFQSRLGSDPWLEPFTDHKFHELPKAGIKNLLVICPAFVSDCLETLEEIAMAGKESFLEAGGTSFTQIPCLNQHPKWIHYLTSKINQWT